MSKIVKKNISNYIKQIFKKFQKMSKNVQQCQKMSKNLFCQIKQIKKVPNIVKKLSLN